MAQSISKVLLHVIFSTKGRRDLVPTDVAADLHAFIAGVCRAQGSEAFRVGGTTDHVHIACTLPRTMTVSGLLEEIKKSSSVWIKNKDSRCLEFAWQAGYGSFSLGQSQLPDIVRYIDSQGEHHKTKSFKEELLVLLQKYKVEYNEEHLWT